MADKILLKAEARIKAPTASTSAANASMNRGKRLIIALLTAWIV